MYDVETDSEGYLTDPSVWTPAWASEVAKAQNLELTEEHWDVLRFVRAQHDAHGITPDARFVIRHLSQTRGAGRNRLFELFPYGYVAQTCKMAGMLRPRTWSTG